MVCKNSPEVLLVKPMAYLSIGYCEVKLRGLKILEIMAPLYYSVYIEEKSER